MSEPVVYYEVCADIRLNTGAPYSLILEVVEQVRSDLISCTSAGSDKNRERFIFESDRITVIKFLDWSAEFTTGWNQAALERLVKKYPMVIASVDYKVWKEERWKKVTDHKERWFSFEHPKEDKA